MRFLNDFLANTVRGSATLIYVFPTDPDLPKGQKSNDFGSYSFSKVRMGNIKRLSKLALSDYHERYENELRGRYSISREISDIVLINLKGYERKGSFSRHKDDEFIFGQLMDVYFAELSKILFDRFLLNLPDELAILTSRHDVIIPSYFLRFVPEASRITFFAFEMDHKAKGYVLPVGQGYYQVENEALRWLTEYSDTLNKQFGLSNLEDSYIYNELSLFAKFVAKAKRFLDDNNIDDAFIHFVIALDLLLGEKGKSMATVSKRAAVVNYWNSNHRHQKHRGNFRYFKLRKDVEDLYALRSNYVHKGESVSYDSVELAEMMCEHVLLVLLHLQNVTRSEAKFNIRSWFKRLDAIASMFAADMEVVDKYFKEIHLIGENGELLNDLYPLSKTRLEIEFGLMRVN